MERILPNLTTDASEDLESRDSAAVWPPSGPMIRANHPQAKMHPLVFHGVAAPNGTSACTLRKRGETSFGSVLVGCIHALALQRDHQVNSEYLEPKKGRQALFNCKATAVVTALVLPGRFRVFQP